MNLITGHRFNSCGIALYKNNGLVAERTEIDSNFSGSITTDRDYIYILKGSDPTIIKKIDFNGNFVEELTFNSGNNDTKNGVALNNKKEA